MNENETKFLHQILKEEFGRLEVEEKTSIPVIITENLNPKFPLRSYQKKALRYFINYWEKEFEGKLNKQLLFQMATGSGKTLIMVGLILSLEKECQIEQLWEDKEYRVWGLPFYNKAKEIDFDKKFNKELL